MDYTVLRVQCAEDIRDILIALLGETGFDTFLETDAGFEAYAEAGGFDADATDNLLQRFAADHALSFSFGTIEKKNWNEEWERSYEPIDVEGECLIRAEFHKPARAYRHEIIITPKMSFGTGHHQTTWLMVKRQMQIDHNGKRVMDAGCGTAILSIMASKLGAREVEAFDIDEWSVVNGNENIAVNNSGNVRIQQGAIAKVALSGLFDIVLANINKNVLLAEMETYASYLRSGGILLLSGFYVDDIGDLERAGKSAGLSVVHQDEKDSWAVLTLIKT